MSKKLITFFFILFFLSGCNIITHYQRDPFYNNGSEWDHQRFPLIKPYYATYAADGHGWGLNLEGEPLKIDSHYIFTVEHIQSIAVEKDILMIYAPIHDYTNENLEEDIPYWFVIIPEGYIEMGFDQESDFSSHIQQFGIKTPSWREPDDILSEYNQTQCLEWIPNCE